MVLLSIEFQRFEIEKRILFFKKRSERYFRIKTEWKSKKKSVETWDA